MDEDREWTTRGFAAFRRGTFGHGGQNLYVSRAGVLQRIHQFDLEGTGHVDLVFCNSQRHHEAAPATLYRDALGAATCQELPSDGARTGIVADLNGDGYDDLVLGNWYNGIGHYMNAFIYFGGPDGWSERAHQRLPAPVTTAVAAGDFDGDGAIDLAFLTAGKLRLFYRTPLGYEPKRYVDLPVEGAQLGAADLDGDGCSDLLVRAQDGRLRVFWGGVGGLAASRSDPVDVADAAVDADDHVAERDRTAAEYVYDALPLAQVVTLSGRPHLFVARPRRAFLVPVAGRAFGEPLVFACQRSLAVAVGDVDGDGHEDLVFACREPVGANRETSWVYWGGESGYAAARRTCLPSLRACDVAVGDLDGDGCAEVALCQGRTLDWFTTQSLVYRGRRDRRLDDPVRLQTHDGRRVHLARPQGGGTRPDLVFTNTQSRRRVEDVDITIYSGGADGFSPARRRDLPGFGAISALTCDVDDDGHPDLVVINSAHNTPSRDPGSYVYLGGPAGFGPRPNYAVPSDLAHGGCCADIDRDGYLELIFAGHRSHELLIFHGTDDGFDVDHPERVPMEHEGTRYDAPLWIYLADLDNDGWLDLVVPQSKADRSLVLWGGPAGYSMARCQLLSVVHGVSARAADLTGNGWLDLIVGGGPPTLGAPHDCFVYIYWNGPQGLSDERRTLLPANGVLSVAVADFDRDGLLDLFVPAYSDSNTRDIDSHIYWNRPGRGFSAWDRSRLFTHSASGCVAVDFDGDGWVDLAVANHKIEGDHMGWSAVWWNGPQGFSEQRQTRLPTSGPHGMLCVDPGNIADRGPEEVYTSAPHPLPDGAHPAAISWEADVPPQTWVRAQLRTAATANDLAQACWWGPGGGRDAWFADGDAVDGVVAPAPWIQYRLALGATNGGRTPRVSAVTLSLSWD